MTRGKEAMVGVVIILAITVAVVGTLWLQGRTFGPVITASVLTESAGQLNGGNTVKYRGVGIGQVADISVLPDGSGVRVTLVFESDVTLPGDAAVVLGPESLFGDWQAEIVSAASYPRFPFFEVPADATGPSPVLGGYALPELSRLTNSAEQISLNLADLTERLELAFNEETTQGLATAIANVQAITEDVRTLVAQQSEVANSITANADSALAEIEIAAGAARRSFELMEGALEGQRLDSILDNVRTASTGLRTMVGELADSTSGLGATLTRVDSTFLRLDRIAARVEEGEGSIGRLLTDTLLAVRAEDVLGQLELLLEDLRENPRRYVRLSIF